MSTARLTIGLLALLAAACGASDPPAGTTPGPTTEDPVVDRHAERARALCEELEPDVTHSRCELGRQRVELPDGGAVELLETQGEYENTTTRRAVYLVFVRSDGRSFSARAMVEENEGGGDGWSEHTFEELAVDGERVSLAWTTRDFVYACTGDPPECTDEEAERVVPRGEWQFVFTCPADAESEQRCRRED